MLSLQNISWVSPDGKKILNGLNLDIPSGKLTVITGPNGSGKTTLAKIIAGIEKPSEGKIFLDDKDITDLDVTERAKIGISFAFQQPVRFKGITVRQLIEIAAQSKLNDKELCDILASVGLCARNYLDREVNDTLSGGEIKRIEIATVIARKTNITVFDEPEAGIDLWSFKSLIGVFKNMHENHLETMLIISHQERILKIADEIVLLADGKINQQGEREKMMQHVFADGGIKPSCRKEEAIFDE